MIINEDLAATYFLFNIAQSMKYIGKYGVLHIITKNSGSRKKYSGKEYISFNLYLIDIIIDFIKDTLESGKIIVNLMINLL